MDVVDSSLKAMDVISVFGPYAKFIVEEIGGECSVGEHYIEYLHMHTCSPPMISNHCVLAECIRCVDEKF